MTSEGIMDYTDFMDFYNNPAIQRIANNKRWTVSTTKDVVDKKGKKRSKMPVDMYELIHNSRIWGCAWDRGHHPLVDLQTVCDTLPTAKTNTYLLDATDDGLVVLDVEGRCPEHLKREFLKLPYLYGEISMSGYGLHLVFELPRQILNKYPNAMTKASLQSENKDYEVLMADHFITFTRNSLPPSDGTCTVEDFERIFEALCRIQKKTVKFDTVNVADVDTESIPDFEKIMTYLRQFNYNKTLEDFEYPNKTGYDNSAYEHYATRYYYTQLKKCIYNSAYTGAVYSDEEKAMLIYSIAKEKIPYREKHDEMRSGMPWLLFLVTRMIGRTDKQDMEWEQENRQKKYEKETPDKPVQNSTPSRYHNLLAKEADGSITSEEQEELNQMQKGETS